jgi:ABC-type glycerol-3-phosphate transport system substrate-binding protein
MKRAGYASIAAAAVAGALALAACGGSSGSTSSASTKTFGVNATGTVHFWARQATDGPAKALVKEFNATHKNLKVILHLTPPNDTPASSRPPSGLARRPTSSG